MAGYQVSASFRSTVSSARLAATATGDFDDAVYGSPVTPSSGRAKLSVTGLTAGEEYTFAVEADGALQLFDRFKAKTPPVGAVSFNFAFGSCARTGSAHYVFDAIRRRNPDLFIHLGDLHYSDINSANLSLYLNAYKTVLSAPAQERLYRNVPSIYVWDDHDYGPNNSDASAPGRSQACEAYRTVVPHAQLVESGTTDAIYHAIEYGRVVFILTDLRSRRVSPTMMGATQKAWFKSLLTDPVNAGKAFIWCSTVPWHIDSRSDTWGGYTAERQELANYFAANDIGRRLAMITGDLHSIGIDDGTNTNKASSGNGSFMVFQAAPFDQSNTVSIAETYSEGFFNSFENEYGFVEVVDNGGDTITLNCTAFAADGTSIVTFSHGLDVSA